jgi:acetate kinase
MVSVAPGATLKVSIQTRFRPNLGVLFVNVLIFNCGSSSQGFKMYRASEGGEPVAVAWGKARNVATMTQAQPVIEWRIGEETGRVAADLSSHRQAAQAILALLRERGVEIDAAGHRFVHGGPFFDRAAAIDDAALERLRACLPFAPLHNPNSFSVIEVCREELPGVTQVAVFDTAFHAHMPDYAREYALPADLRARGFRKYGFHGLSYQYVSGQVAALMGRPLEQLKLIICHLGTGGSSVVAIRDGRSLDTSMGYSPLPGLIMSTRCGDIDAEVALELVRGGMTPDEVSSLLNYQSGLIGLSAFSSNLEEVIAEAERGNADCQLAYDAYTHRLRLYLGAYTWLLGGADALVFTDDVGLRSWRLREKVCAGVEALGVEIDSERNRAAPHDAATRISAAASRTQVWVVPTDEEAVILRETLALLAPR